MPLGETKVMRPSDCKRMHIHLQKICLFEVPIVWCKQTGVWNIHSQEDTRSILEDSQLIFGRFAVDIWKIRG